jgi:hypothetical protein
MDTEQLSTLARELAALAASLRAGTDVAAEVEHALLRLALLAVDVIPDADLASVTIAEHKAFRTVCSTHPRAEAVDAAQFLLHEGPCIDAPDDGSVLLADDLPGSVLLADDLRGEERWPRFTAAAMAQGIHAVMSFRLHLLPGDGRVASLNIYAGKPFAFADEGIAVGSLMVAHLDLAFAALRGQERIRNLERALESNREIGVAIGILMARKNVQEDQAFVLLRQASQQRNRKVRELAADVVQTGELPDRPVRGTGASEPAEPNRGTGAAIPAEPRDRTG